MEIILIVYLVVSLALIGIILLQQGKGAEMGASFGAGGANTVFGAAGSGNALTKATTILAILFFSTAVAISYFNAEPKIIVDDVLDVTAPVEKKTNIESELPKAQDDLASEVAPESEITAEKPVKNDVKSTDESTVKAQDKPVEEDKASDDEKTTEDDSDIKESK